MEQKKEQGKPERQESLMPVPMQQSALPLGEISEEDMQRRIKYAERYAETLDRIKKVAIRMTNKNDWVDQDGQPYLQLSGATKIAAGFGIQIFGVESAPAEYHKDDRGEYLEYVVSGYARWNNLEVHEVGVANTRDKFFASRTKDGKAYYLPLSEVDKPSVRKKAHTNFYNRVVKNLLGLYFTWDDINSSTNGIINQNGSAVVKYTKGSRGGNTDTAETKDKREELRRMILEMCDGEEEPAKAMLMRESAFTSKDGKNVPGKNNVQALSEGRINVTYEKVRKLYTKGVTNGTAQHC